MKDRIFAICLLAILAIGIHTMLTQDCREIDGACETLHVKHS